jgi:hypothetical protein
VDMHSMTSQSVDQNSSAGYHEYKTV